MTEEQVVIVDEKNRELGQAGRHEMRSRNLIHRASYIMVQEGAKGKLFVQRRSAAKDLYPGLYEPGCAGVVLTGESYEQAAQRELAEELGVRGVMLRFAFDFWQETEVNRVWGRVFCCEWQGKIVVQPEEVSWGGFMTQTEIADLKARQMLTPDGLLILGQLGPYL